MRNMLISEFSNEDGSWPKLCDLFFTLLTIVHVHQTIENDEGFWPVVHMPFVRLIGPMQAHSGALNFRKIERLPRAGATEIAAIFDDLGHLSRRA